MQGVCGEGELRVAQVHVVVEHRLACLGVVFSPVAHEHVVSVHHLSSLEEISDIVETVVVETVSIQFRSAMA